LIRQAVEGIEQDDDRIASGVRAAVCSFRRFRNQPLINCVMPTPGRPHFATQAIAYFRRQNYVWRFPIGTPLKKPA
jgi:hypothetical protein